MSVILAAGGGVHAGAVLAHVGGVGCAVRHACQVEEQVRGNPAQLQLY